MSDDMWRDRRDRDDFSEYGSLFDDAEPTGDVAETERGDIGRHAAVGDDDSGAISFGEGGAEPLPHWTEPPTGEVPRFATPDEEHEELDVWSSFSSESPVWKEDADAEIDAPTSGVAAAPVTDAVERLDTGQHRRVGDQPARSTGQHRRVSGESELVIREPSRITIGTDPSGVPRRSLPPGQRRRGSPPPSAARPRPSAAPPPAGRDMPVAIVVGVALAAAFILALRYEPWAVACFVTLILGLAAVEFYDKVSEKGYRPAIVPGIVTCVAAPAAAYWLGDGALPLVLAFGFIATSASFIGARSVEAGPMPNVSITTLGIVWIGLLGSFAMLILRLSTNSGSALAAADHRGTDTLFLLALGVVANDVGALLAGSAIGRTPLRPWISPNKTVEGLIGGALMTIVVMVVIGMFDRTENTTWMSLKHRFILAIVVAVMAPIGDLIESMFKRNLDTKDFGSIVKGHGGVLDRFDGFLLTLPAVYYLTLVLEPWTAVATSGG